MTEEEQNKMNKIVADAIGPKLKEARMQGILIGWRTACIQLYKGTKDMHNAKAIRKYLKDYADKMEEHLFPKKEDGVKVQDENQGN